jgi:cobalamin biosynthesis Mg chelatase CobN
MTNFIREQFIEDIDLCDEIINYFDNSKDQFQGMSSYGVDTSVKDSTDCYLLDETLLKRYADQLTTISKDYVNSFPFSNNYGPWGIIDYINIQKYNPSQAYHAWHTERASHQIPNSSRHLVFMTYLNTVVTGGETEFYHQDIKIQPQKGLTVIWPADWTHTHRGCPSLTETKYIVTGWFNFMEG